MTIRSPRDRSADLTELQKEAAAESGFRLLYVDECDLHTHPHLLQVWQRRGRPLMVPAAGPDQRRTVFGPVDYASGHVLRLLTERKGGDGLAAFLMQIAETWPDEQLVLVMDNVSYHRTPLVRGCWAAQQGHVAPFWLPVYTPNLNLMERIWRYLKQQLARHLFWSDVDGLEATAAALLDRIEAHFHAEDGPSIFLRRTSAKPLSN